MVKINLIVSQFLSGILFISVLTLSVSLHAQNAVMKSSPATETQKEGLKGKTQVAYNPNNLWQAAILRADGLSDVGGVEAYAMRTTCMAEDIVLIKLVNKNDYKVRVEWVDAIKTDEGWIYSKSKNTKSMYLEPGATIIGQCDGLEKLKVNVNSILENAVAFRYFSVSGLTTTKIN